MTSPLHATEAVRAAAGARLPSPWPSRTLHALSVGLVTVSLIGLAVGLVVSADLASAGLLITGFFLLGPALGSLLLLALLHVTDAGWAVAVRRVPEALVGLLPVSLVSVLAVLILRPQIYPWWSDDALVGFKGWWLTPLAFRLRAFVYAGAWLLFAVVLVRRSRTGARPVGLSALFLVIFSLTFWLASVDWLMSFEPHWYSTIFGVYRFASLLAAALATVTLAVLWLRRGTGLGRVVRDEHLHDLGKLLFAFTTFWAYTWFSQYMLIWYADLPEEAVFFTLRAQGPWQPVFWTVLVLHWLLPFLLLMTRRAKRRSSTLVVASVAVLLGAYLDLALTVLPALGLVPGPAFVAVSVGGLCGGVGAGLWLFTGSLRRRPLVATDDPHLEESLTYHS